MNIGICRSGEHIIIQMNGLFDQLLSISSIRWQRILEDFHTMSSFMRKMVLIVSDGFTKERCIAGYLLTKRVHKLVKAGGLLTTALYLKQCSSCLQKAYGGDPTGPLPLPIYVSLTRSGLPRIIPPFHRKKIRRHDDEADELVKLYLSLFSISRVVKLASRIRKTTFSSIVTPTRDPTTLVSFLKEIRVTFSDLYNRYIPWVSEVPLSQGVRWVPTWKSLPSHPLMNFYINFEREERDEKPIRKFRSCFPAFSFEMTTFAYYATFCRGQERHNVPGALWPEWIRYALDPQSEVNTKHCLDYFNERVFPNLPDFSEWDESLFVGRLGQSLEEGTKRRIFAIGNYVNQRLLAPVHDWAMSILRKIPMDGTFNQTKPLDRLAGQQVAYSYDLKSATDRWPLPYMFWVFERLFDKKFAQSVLFNTLSCNAFEVPFVNRKKAKGPSLVSFLTGQPLGYLSSWPLFALSHHVLVWWAAEQVHKGRYFNQYAVLGDDIVITDEKVALKYRWAVTQLGVDISDQKSLISHRGAGEFAKRFRVRNLTKDISPVSFKALKSCNHPYGLLGLHLKYNFKRFSTLLRVGGSGYRVLANYSKSKNKTVRRLYLMFNKANSLSLFSNLEWWFGKGRPLNPYLKGLMVQYMLKVLKPKELTVPPDCIYSSSECLEMDEYTVRRGWVSQWLRYLRWYWCVAHDPYVPLDALFYAPEVTSHYKAIRRDPLLVKFGHIWKLWDFIGKVTNSPCVPILGEGHTLKGVWLLGGIRNKMFLVSAVGLNQPAVGGRVVGFEYSNPPTFTVRYKTLSVADRKVSLDYFG